MPQGEILPDVDTMFPPYKGFTGTYSPYFRRKKKQLKQKIQFLSKKDPRKRPSRVMWIRRKTQKRKSGLAKQKYRYAGIPHTSEFPGRMRFESTTQTHMPGIHSGQSSDEMMETARAANRYMDPQVYEGAYRRKGKKRVNHKLKKRATKKKR